MNPTNFSVIAAAVFVLASPVFRCEAPGEAPLFSDLPCPHGSVVDLEPAPLIQSVSTPVIDVWNEEFTNTGSPQRTTRSLSRRPAAISKVEQCETARTGLRAVQMKKRKGYSLAEAAQLEAELREHRDMIRSTCW